MSNNEVFVSEYHPDTGAFHVQTLRETLIYNNGIMVGENDDNGWLIIGVHYTYEAASDACEKAKTAVRFESDLNKPKYINEFLF